MTSKKKANTKDGTSSTEVFKKSAAGAGGVIAGLGIGTIIIIVIVILVICGGCTACCLLGNILESFS